MNEPPPSDQEDFQQELDALRSILQQNLQKLNQDPFLDTRLEFWLESANFLVTEMDIWERVGDVGKREQAVERMQKVLGILQELIDHLNAESGDGKNSS